LKTVDSLSRYQGVSINISTIYRFLDKLNNRLKEQIVGNNQKLLTKIITENV